MRERETANYKNLYNWIIISLVVALVVVIFLCINSKEGVRLSPYTSPTPTTSPLFQQEEPTEPLRCDEVRDATTSGVGTASWKKETHRFRNVVDFNPVDPKSMEEYHQECEKIVEAQFPAAEFIRMLKEAGDKAMAACKENARLPDCAFPCNAMIRNLNCKLNPKSELSIDAVYDVEDFNNYIVYCKVILKRTAEGTYQKVCEAEG